MTLCRAKKHLSNCLSLAAGACMLYAIEYVKFVCSQNFVGRKRFLYHLFGMLCLFLLDSLSGRCLQGGLWYIAVAGVSNKLHQLGLPNYWRNSFSLSWWPALSAGPVLFAQKSEKGIWKFLSEGCTGSSGIGVLWNSLGKFARERNVHLHFRVSETHMRRVGRKLAGMAGKHGCLAGRSARMPSMSPGIFFQGNLRRGATGSGKQQQQEENDKAIEGLSKPKQNVFSPPNYVRRTSQDKVYTSLGASPANTCDPETAVPDWLRSGCPSGMSASPTDVCGVLPATVHRLGDLQVEGD